MTLASVSGKLFNLRRLRAKTKVQEATTHDFIFADDCALNASTQSDNQRSMDQFSKACDDFGLTISTKKTQVLFQQAPATPYTEPTIIVNGKKLKVADKFVCLGSTLSRHVSIDEEVNYRISRASSAFGRLYDKVWERRGISVKTKLKVYRAVVLPSLLYACETWTVYSRACQTAQFFSHALPQKHHAHQMAGQNSCYRGTPESRDGERLRHAQVLPAQMGRSCRSHV